MSSNVHSSEDLNLTSSEVLMQMTPAEAQMRMITQLKRVKVSLITGGDRVSEMQEIDGLYNALKEDAAAASAFVESTARGLFSDTELFNNLHFQSSLLTSRSTFFGDILRKMGDLVDQEPEQYEAKTTLSVHIRLVEHYRRKRSRIKREIATAKGDAEGLQTTYAQSGDQMEKFMKQVEGKLNEKVAAEDPLACAQLGKVRYEQALDMRDNQQKYAEAIAFGQESAMLCKQGGDLFGELTAQGNAVYDSKTKWAKAMGSNDPESAVMINEAREGLATDLLICRQTLETLPKGSFEEDRFLRLWINNGVQLADAAVQQGDLRNAEKILDELKENSLFVSQRKSGAYQEYYDMVERLRQNCYG